MKTTLVTSNSVKEQNDINRTNLIYKIVNGIPGDNAGPDCSAKDVWRDDQNTFFDVRITNTNSASQHNIKTENVLLRHEKKRNENMIGEL